MREDPSIGTTLFRQPAGFVKGVVNIAGLPEPDRVEVAFAGRSNVGKSSLLNALVGRRQLARTSRTPGRTQELNFFALRESCYLVDLPGYGYARAGKAQVAAWSRLVRDYLRGRAVLRRVFLLIDARHGLKPSDREIAELLDRAAVSYQVVLTKIDKLKGGQLQSVLGSTTEAIARHPAAHPAVLATSATDGAGLPELRAAIAALIEG